MRTWWEDRMGGTALERADPKVLLRLIALGGSNRVAKCAASFVVPLRVRLRTKIDLNAAALQLSGEAEIPLVK